MSGIVYDQWRRLTDSEGNHKGFVLHTMDMTKYQPKPLPDEVDPKTYVKMYIKSDWPRLNRLGYTVKHIPNLVVLLTEFLRIYKSFEESGGKKLG